MKERLMEFIKEKDISNRKFLLKCGLSGTYISTLTGNPSGDTLKKIEAAYPELNTEWLLTGKGTMLKNEAVMPPADDTAAIISQNKVIAQAMEQGMGITDADNIDISAIPVEVVEEIREEIKAEIEEAGSVPFVSSKVANDANVNVRKFVEKRGDEMERIKPNDLVGEADIAERIRKGSMMPTFMPGDIVFVRFLDDMKIISDGHIYYFDMKGRPTIIRKVKFEGDKLRLIADNPNFGDIITTFDEIDNIADIVGMFRSSFSNQYAEMEEIRRRKDAQVDKLVEQNGEALKIIHDLIKR